MVIICSQSEDWIAAKLSDVHPSCYPLFSMAWLPSSNGRLTYMPWTTNKLASEDDVFCNLLLSSSHGVGTLLSLGHFNMKNFPIMPSMDNWTSDVARQVRLHIQADLPKVSRMVAKPYHDQERGDQERLAALGSTDQEGMVAQQ
ncbi:uncharacterized protein [Lolium perenne]|uniref:uncharacterized protein isoform X2 n=1 Tax=Lolium perenne TaxID=4522 RepID=UPI0021F538CF|nr:uncharacterized protein LOC127334690 isoform X2 [Lolium perenne]